MNEFLKNLIAQYALDRGVWVAVATWLTHFVTKKFGVTVDQASLISFLVAVATWGVTHFLHVKTVDQSSKIQVPPFDNKN